MSASNTCPVCHVQLKEDGSCPTSGMYYVCFYKKDPNGDHFLVVSDVVDPETGREWEIEHPKGCKQVEFFGGYMDYDCAASEAIREDWAEGDEAFDKPGRYLIEVWGGKSWTDYGWEGDGGVFLTPVDRQV